MKKTNKPPRRQWFSKGGLGIAAALVTATQVPISAYALPPPPPMPPTVYTTNADFAWGTLVNVNYTDVADQLQLNSSAEPFNFMWVAVSTKGTVVKIDTNTGQILGEYQSSPEGMSRNPSRTTVDKGGGVWLTNRDEAGWVGANTIAQGVPPEDRNMGSVVHVGLVERNECIDRNHNGVIDTSHGLNDIRHWSNAGGADTLGGVSTAEDECILHFTRVNSNGTRHVSVDANNDIWVSGTGGRYFDLVDDVTGTIIRQEPSVGYGGYGGLIDGNGFIWSAGNEHLLRWDTAYPLSGANGDPDGRSIGPFLTDTHWAGQSYGGEYGLCKNPNTGEVWNTSYGGGGIARYAPDGTFIGEYWEGNWYAQGCVVDRNDHVWVAHSMNGSNTVGHLAPDGTHLGNVTVGSGPTGVAVDGNGKIWATNYYDGTVSRIDPSLNGGVGAVDFTTEYLGGNPYDYSDMTGSTLNAPPNKGTWSVVYDNGALSSLFTISWTSDTPADSALGVQVACSSNGVDYGVPSDVTNGVVKGVGTSCQYLKVIANFTRGSGGESPILYDLTIQGGEVDACGPGIALTTSPTALWQMLALPCKPDADPSTVATVFGSGTLSNLPTERYGNKWILYKRSLSGTAYAALTKTSPLDIGSGYWIKSLISPTDDLLAITGSATPVTLDDDDCPSIDGCVVTPVFSNPQPLGFKIIGNPFPFDVDWSRVLVRVNGSTIYTPSQAAGVSQVNGAPDPGNANPPVLSNQFWIWNGTTYQSWTDLEPNKGNLRYFKSFWINVLPGARGKSIELLIPAEPYYNFGPMKVKALTEREQQRSWYLAWLDWIIPSAAADDRAAGLVRGPIRPPKSAQAQWKLRLTAENPKTGWVAEARLGQWTGAAVGYDPMDLNAMEPFASPYLTLVFPQSSWGLRKGDYATDFRSTSNLPAKWNLEVRADPVGAKLVLRWEATPADVLAHSRLIDGLTGKVIDPRDPAYTNGYPLTMTTKVRRLTWEYRGN